MLTCITGECSSNEGPEIVRITKHEKSHIHGFESQGKETSQVGKKRGADIRGYMRKTGCKKASNNWKATKNGKEKIRIPLGQRWGPRIKNVFPYV